MRGMAFGHFSALTLVHCLSSALAGDAAPAASAGAVDAADVRQELLGRIWELEQKMTELSEASSRPLPAAVRAFGPEGDFVELAEGKRCDPTNETLTASLTMDECKKCDHVYWEEGQCHADLIVLGFKGLSDEAAYCGQWLTTDQAFFLAIFLVLQWHLRFHFGEWLHQKVYSSEWLSSWKWLPREEKPMMVWRRFGLNILILGIYNDDDLQGVSVFKDTTFKDKPFACSMAVVFFDTVVLYYFFALLGLFVNPDPSLDSMQQWLDPVEEIEDDGRCPEKCQADNIYEDLTIRYRRVLPIFWAQMGLIMLYIVDLNTNDKTKNPKKYHYFQWMLAVIFQIYAGDQQLGAAYNSKFWMHILGTQRVLERVKNFISGSNSTQAEQPLLDSSNSTQTKELLLNKEARLKSALQKMRLPPRQVEKFLQRKQDITDEDVRVFEDISNKDIEDGNEASAIDAFFKGMEVELEDEFKRMLRLEESLQYLGSLMHKVFRVVPVKYWFEWECRRIMDFIVNSICRNIILYTVPIMVCVEDPLDMVKDLTAVMFITMMDNIDGDPKDIAEISAKLKYRAQNPRKGLSAINSFALWKGLGPSKVCLNMFEKNFIQGHNERFSHLELVGGDAWRKFRLKGIPMTEEELDAEEDRERHAQP